MVDPAVIEEVKRLLADGQLSQRAVARVTGVSRSTVGAVAAGRRADYAARVPTVRPNGPPERCPGCGALVAMPCLACRMEAALSRRAGKVADPGAPGELKLQMELRESDRRRYEQIHCQKKLNQAEDDERPLLAAEASTDQPCGEAWDWDDVYQPEWNDLTEEEFQDAFERDDDCDEELELMLNAE